MAVVNTLNGNSVPAVGAPARGSGDVLANSEVQVNPFQSIPLLLAVATAHQPVNSYTRFDWL